MQGSTVHEEVVVDWPNLEEQGHVEWENEDTGDYLRQILTSVLNLVKSY